MTLFNLYHIISYALTEDHNLLFHHLKGTEEDKDIGEVWYFVIAFKDEFDPDNFKDNEYTIHYDPNHSPEAVKDFYLSQGFTDIFTQILFKNTGS